MATYNGHRSWNAWNVSLWISNDENLYNLASECLRRPYVGRRAGQPVTLRSAAKRFLDAIGWDSKTPDGAKYNLTCVSEALTGLE